jgi:hypothetical protein
MRVFRQELPLPAWVLLTFEGTFKKRSVGQYLSLAPTAVPHSERSLFTVRFGPLLPPTAEAVHTGKRAIA